MSTDGPKTPPDPPEPIVSDVVTSFPKPIANNNGTPSLAELFNRQLQRSVSSGQDRQHALVGV